MSDQDIQASRSPVEQSGDSSDSVRASDVLSAADISAVGGVAIGGEHVVVQGDFIGRDIVGRDIIGRGKVVISYHEAFERVIGATNFVLNQLELSYKQTREQAESWFRMSLIAAGVGFVLIAIGVIAVIFGQATGGLITAISSMVPNAASALFFVQSKNANARVDAIQTRLTEAREVQTAVEIVETIEDAKSRDKLKAEIVRKVLQLEQKTSKR